MATQYPAFPFYAYPQFGRTFATAAGNSAATGFQIVAPITAITGGTSGGAAGVTLPANSAGTPYLVANFTAFGTYVWAPVGYGLLGSGSQGNGYALPPWSSAVFSASPSAPLQYSATELYSIPVGTTPA